MAFKIKELRDERRMSQDELAQKSGISRVIISNLETGAANNPTVRTLDKIALALGVDVRDLFFDESV